MIISGALQPAEEERDTKKKEREKGTFWRKDGKLRDSAAGLFPVAHWHRRTDHRDYPAAVEDVRVHRGQHHHGGGHVPGAVDVMRLPEHRAAPVQNLRLHPAARQ